MVKTPARTKSDSSAPPRPSDLEPCPACGGGGVVRRHVHVMRANGRFLCKVARDAIDPATTIIRLLEINDRSDGDRDGPSYEERMVGRTASLHAAVSELLTLPSWMKSCPTCEVNLSHMLASISTKLDAYQRDAPERAKRAQQRIDRWNDPEMIAAYPKAAAYARRHGPNPLAVIGATTAGKPIDPRQARADARGAEAAALAANAPRSPRRTPAKRRARK